MNVEGFEEREKISKGPSNPVEAGYDDDLDALGLDVCEEFLKAFPLRVLGTEALISVDPVDSELVGLAVGA